MSLLAPQKKAKPETPKNYYLKEGDAEIDATTPLDRMRHNNCGGTPIVRTTAATKNYTAKSIAQCGKCRHELFLGTSREKNLERYKSQYHTERLTQVFSDKLEPVFRSIDVVDDHVAYSSWQKLPPKQLIKYYHPKKEVVVLDAPKGSVV